MKPDLAKAITDTLDHLADELVKTNAAFLAAAQVTIEAGADGVDLSEYPSILIKCDEAKRLLRAQFEDGLAVIAKLRDVPHEEALRASWAGRS